MRLFTLSILLMLGACVEPPSVTAGGERLIGERTGNGINVFRGIPFAEPPVGKLRWQLPRPYEAQLAERDATRFAPACMQSPRILEWYRDMAETFGASRDVVGSLDVSEDCLYLNVWTPRLGTRAQLPVLVYIHGGSNSSGWAYEPNYHGHALAGRDAVVVSVSYRLGVFGFFSHPELDNANYGLWDQVLALEWGRDNIRAFGGDPNRVMVFGESAGAQNVLALMASDIAKPLFHSAVLQSTAGFGIGRRASPTLYDEMERGVGLATALRLEGPGTIDRLRRISAGKLLEIYESQFGDYYHSPAIDGVLLEKPVWAVINDGELSDIPFIIGSNADEWYESTPADVSGEDVADWVDQKHFISTDEALKEVASEPDPREAIDRIDSAEYMLCPSQFLAAHQAARNGNAWVYYFSRVRDGEGGAAMRAYHGAELPYVFGTHDAWMTTTDIDISLTRQMMRYWINLASGGNPNGDNLPDWPVFSGAEGQVMTFGNAAELTAPQEPVLCRIFLDNVSTAN
jgi:para-nitrobenzyl esterase